MSMYSYSRPDSTPVNSGDSTSNESIIDHVLLGLLMGLTVFSLLLL